MKQKKYFLLKTLLTFLFMSFIIIITICFLYNSINITKEEYFNLLLSDTYEKDLYIKIVETINKYFNPFNIIELNIVESNTFNLSNEYIDSPEIYIINNNQTNTYKEEYNVIPTIIYTSYFLSNRLNELNINTIFEENKINNNEEYNLYLNEKKEIYKSIKYIFNINISNSNTKVKCDKNYAIINLYAQNNIEFISKLNTKLNEKCSGISNIYILNKDDDVINIDIGNVNNSMKEVFNSVNLFSIALKEVI